MIPKGWRGMTLSRLFEKEVNNTPKQTELLLGCTQCLCYVVRGEGEVSELDYSAVIVQSVWAICHMDWIVSQGQVLKIMMKWHLYSTSCFLPSHRTFLTGFAKRRRQFPFLHFKGIWASVWAAKTVFSYSPYHSWNLILHCVCRDSTAVLRNTNAFK